MPNFIDLSGQQFGRLRVIGRTTNQRRLVQWNCLCDCGAEAVASTKKLRNGRKQSCGCLWLDAITEAKTKHGHSSGRTVSSELRTWMALRGRCNNPRNRAFQNYGGRGIRVCERWNDFSMFLADMGPRPKGTSIDRIDNARGYEPGNCRWALPAQQCRNRRNNIFVLFDGRQMCVTDAARLAGLKRQTVLHRVKAGWPAERLLLPVALPTAPPCRS